MEDLSAIQKAFSKQSEHYDHDDFANPIIVSWRKQVYGHVNLFMKPGSRILELNAGTGIDAVHFVNEGHYVHATDIAPGMISQLQKKAAANPERFTVQSCSFRDIHALATRKYDYVFSNMGGLNCIGDVAVVAQQLPVILQQNAIVTWVIMPPVCPWEWLALFKGKKTAWRRFLANGTVAHLEGEYFKTYYHSLSTLKKAFGPRFKFLKTEGLGSLSPPPSGQRLRSSYPKLIRFLEKLDRLVRYTFPFNRWADHIIVTFQFSG